MEKLQKLQHLLDFVVWLVKTIAQIVFWLLVLWLLVSRWVEINQLPIEVHLYYIIFLCFDVSQCSDDADTRAQSCQHGGQVQ